MPLTTAERAVRALRVHAPDRAAPELTELGRGLDHAAFRCGDLVVRVGDGGDVRRERDLLAVVGPRVSLAVPAPVFVDGRLGVMAYPMLPGRPLLGRELPAGSARRLGAFLTELHAIELPLVAHLVPADPADPGDWLEDLTGPPALLAEVRATVPPPGTRRVLAHTDLGAEHLLEQDGAVTGVIDWSDAAVTDPALDFARLLRDGGPGFLREVLDAYGLQRPDADATARIAFFARCAALEDLAHARDGGAAEYATAATASLAWLFPGLPSS